MAEVRPSSTNVGDAGPILVKFCQIWQTNGQHLSNLAKRRHTHRPNCCPMPAGKSATGPDLARTESAKLVQSWPKIGRSESKVLTRIDHAACIWQPKGQRWPMLGQYRPTKCRSEPNFVSSLPMLVEFGRTFANQAQFGRCFGQLWSNPGHISTRGGAVRRPWGVVSATTGQLRSPPGS